MDSNGVKNVTRLHIALKSYGQSHHCYAMISFSAPMKILNAFFLQCLLVTAAFFASPFEIDAANSTPAPGQSGDSSWPRERFQNGNRLIVYQPQIDDWKDFQDLSWRMAVSLTPKSGKTAVGVVEMKGTTSIDNAAKLVNISNLQITGTYFPSLDKATADKMEQAFKSFVPSTFSISLFHLISSTPK
jgi:hypothetical protein